MGIFPTANPRQKWGIEKIETCFVLLVPEANHQMCPTAVPNMDLRVVKICSAQILYGFVGS